MTISRIVGVVIIVLTSVKLVPAQVAGPEGVMRETIERFSADYGSISRSFPLEMSDTHREKVRSFLLEWKSVADGLHTSGLSPDDRVDLVLFRNHLEHRLRTLEIALERRRETAPFIQFAERILRLEENRRAMKPVDPEEAAGELARALEELDEVKELLRRGANDKPDGPPLLTPTKVQADRAAGECDELKHILGDWYSFYAGYDPLFTWWVEAPYRRMDRALGSFVDFLRKDLAGITGSGDDDIVGDPIGRETLLSELKHEMIAYSPEELIEIAGMEYAWCLAEMKKAAAELGYEDDWLKGVEHVKNLHEPPGQQPQLIKMLAEEAVDFLESRDLVTIPPLAKESWRMGMMSAERQRVSPFFTGGEVISIAFPLDSMQHEEKLMSLRGNNIHFSRAVTHHELIPGHHLQGFMMNRYRTHRRVFWTPFWVEGWALYWELQLWDLGFPKSAENRIGMLFWRMHRCARIIFSLKFHLGQMTPQECIDMLVEDVGHEKANATAEVRRSFNGTYPPLYQAAYMVGALQFRSLYREVVERGGMSPKEFHDRILTGNVMPVEMIRVLLNGVNEGNETQREWRFYEELK